MTKTGAATRWHEGSGLAATIARNVSTRYLVIVVEAAIGFILLPFNVEHLGRSAYGLWMLVASITTYFSVLDLGYAQSLVRFVAEYRAKKDPGAINEVMSTLFVLFAGAGVLTMVAAGVVAWQLDTLFHLEPGQLFTGRAIVLMVSTHVACGFLFTVFGAVINGFQRFALNNAVSLVTTVAAAAVNVAVLLAGYGLVEVVAATTAVRLIAYVAYRRNAYKVFPELRVNPSLFRVDRLKEVSAFSAYVLVLDWSEKLNYSLDAIVVGAVLGTAAVAVWTVAERLASLVQRFTNQLNEVLFPAVVESGTTAETDRLRGILVHGTMLSLAAVLPAGVSLFFLAGPLVAAWVGPGFGGSILVAKLLALVVMVRVGEATAATVLKGAGLHRKLAAANVATAVANVALSLVLVRAYGLPGVAVGTLLPVAVAASLVVFPAASRRVGLTLAEALRQSVFPALWPAVVVALGMSVASRLVPPSLLAVAAAGAGACLTYFALFVVAIGADERNAHLARLRAWLERRRMPVAA